MLGLVDIVRYRLCAHVALVSLCAGRSAGKRGGAVHLDTAVMERQLAHLHEVAESPTVDIQILPFSAGAHAAGAGNFVILGRDDERNPPNSMAVVYIELRRRGLYIDDTEDVGDYKLTFDYLRSRAADAAASLRLLAGARQELSS